MRKLGGYTYIMASENNQVVYVGVTSDLSRRIWQHKNQLGCAFTKKYKITKLVYYEALGTIGAAIRREKQLKGGSRQKKINLINSINPDWKDLYLEF